MHYNSMFKFLLFGNFNNSARVSYRIYSKYGKNNNKFFIKNSICAKMFVVIEFDSFCDEIVQLIGNGVAYKCRHR